MKTAYITSLMLAVVLIFTGCGMQTEEVDYSIDNEYNNWDISYSDGYAGGDVIFGRERIVGQWSTYLVTVYDPTAENPFDHTYYYDEHVLGIGFDSTTYYEYWSDYYYGEWTPIADYRVSRDGKILQIGDNTFYYLNQYDNECMLVEHIQSGNEFLLCKESEEIPY